jgi:MoaA/NifB/PqqE/SkfB family radical SAM enzyme
VLGLVSSILSTGSVKFACIHLTTKCNAKCVDRCNIWSQKPIDMDLKEAKYALDILTKSGFRVAYFTGGETGLYPHLAEIIEYAKKRGFVTSITTNGTIEKATLRSLKDNLDVLSVSVDHYDKHLWEEAKHHPGIGAKAEQTIRYAKAYGIKVYAITFLNPSWSENEVEKTIRYVNDELGVSFTLSYPYVSSSYGSFVVGGDLRNVDFESNMINLVGKVLQMKAMGAKVANATCYLKDVIRALNGKPMRYACKAGKTVIAIDCNLNVFPCYKQKQLFNLRDKTILTPLNVDNHQCDNKNCLINGYKEPSLASRENLRSAIAEELLSNPIFYARLLL